MASDTLSAGHRTISEVIRNKNKYLVWERDGLLHRLCQIDTQTSISEQLGHSRTWLTNVLAGRKVILWHDMLALCSVLADLHEKKHPWDTRELFPDPPSSGVSMLRTVRRHAPRSTRVILNPNIFPEGTTVVVTFLEAKA